MGCPYCNSDEGYYDGFLTMQCGGCKKSSTAALWGSKPIDISRKRGRGEDASGTHGDKKHAQKKFKTAGDSHESEHVVGYNVMAPQLARGQTSEARKVENIAAAYQEHKPAHRGHPGTGTHNDWRGTKLSSKDYRENQRRLLQAKKVGVAVQLNQLHYAEMPEFRGSNSMEVEGLKKADASFNHMVENFPGRPAQRRRQVVHGLRDAEGEGRDGAGPPHGAVRVLSPR